MGALMIEYRWAMGVLKVRIGAFEVAGVSGGPLKVSRTSTGAIEVLWTEFEVPMVEPARSRLERAGLFSSAVISAISDPVRLSTELACRRPF